MKIVTKGVFLPNHIHRCLFICDFCKYIFYDDKQFLAFCSWDSQFFTPAFIVINSVKSHIIPWRMGWMLGCTELAECVEISVLVLCVVVDMVLEKNPKTKKPKKTRPKLIPICKGNIWNVQNEKLSMELCTEFLYLEFQVSCAYSEVI